MSNENLSREKSDLVKGLNVLEKLFKGIMDVNILREDLWKLLCGVCSEEAKWISESPGSHLEMMMGWESLLDAAEILQHHLRLGEKSQISMGILLPPKMAKSPGNYILFLPKYLNEEEICCPVKVLKNFFEIRDLPSWKALLEEWGKTCLSNFTIYANMEINKVLQAYRELVKLIEACHLISVRVKCKNIIGGIQEAEDKHARTLKALCYLFREKTPFPVWRTDMLKLLKGANTNNIEIIGSCPGDAVERITAWKSLIGAAFKLSKNSAPMAKVELTNESVVPFYAHSCPLGSYFEWDFFPKYLQKDEIKEPYIYLKEFFCDYTRKRLTLFLEELVQACLSDNRLEDAESMGNFKSIAESLLKLLEACHLIYIREYPKLDQNHNIKNQENETPPID